MHDGLVSELESAIADLGALLVRVQKYRRGADREGAALHQEALAVGDAARRLHRRGTLDETRAGELLAAVHGLGGRVRELEVAIRASAEYCDALAARRAGDPAALATAVHAVFAGLEPVTPPPVLYHAVSCLRRGRLRPVADLVDETVAVRDEGLGGEGDDLAVGADGDLPAAIFRDRLPADTPVALRFSALDTPVHRLADTDDYLVHAVPVRASFVVSVATAFTPGEQLRVELTATDWDRYREELTGALGHAGIPVA